MLTCGEFRDLSKTVLEGLISITSFPQFFMCPVNDPTKLLIGGSYCGKRLSQIFEQNLQNLIKCAIP